MKVMKIGEAQFQKTTQEIQKSQKSMTHKFTNAQILIKLINRNHENW